MTTTYLKQHGIPMRYFPLVMQAAHHTVHKGIQGGATTLGPELNISPATLSNQVNPEQCGHKFGLEDSLYIQLRTHSFEILLQYAAALGHTVIPVGDFTGLSDVELLNSYSNWHAELGDVNKAVSKALSDHKITASEFEEIEREFVECVAAGQAFVARCRALVEK